MLRWASTVCFVFYVATPVWWRLLSVFDSRVVTFMVPQLIASGLGLVVRLVAMTYARLLALRLPDERLARSTGQVMWLLAATGLAGIAITVLESFPMGADLVSGVSALMPVGTLIACIYTAIHIWWLVVMLRYWYH